VLLALVLGSNEVARAHERSTPWTVARAESVSTVRGMRVRVHECRGVGQGVMRKGITRYRHFRCVAGARASFQDYDSVAVVYVLHALPRNRFVLTNVRFIGGPGVP
jgi:hypothetical protein